MFHRTNLIFREKLTPRTLTKYIVLHHTAVRGDKQPVTDIHQWHLDRKWAGYRFHPNGSGLGHSRGNQQNYVSGLKSIR